MSFENEFGVVDLIISSKFETKGVDAFALSLIKSERQMRRLFTHLVFQSNSFNRAHVASIRNALSDNRYIYFRHFELGFNQVSKYSAQELIGEKYHELKSNLDKAQEYRNKIFHGQLTHQMLSTNELLDLVENIKIWCQLLSSSCKKELGYDGFERNSLRKSISKKSSELIKLSFHNIEDYKNFLKKLEKEHK